MDYLIISPVMLTYQKSVLQISLFQIEVKNSEGRSAKFDAVVFTIPAPQLLDIDMDGHMSPEVSTTSLFTFGGHAVRFSGLSTQMPTNRTNFGWNARKFCTLS